MVIFKNTPNIQEYSLYKNEIKDKVKIIKKIGKNKSENRKISKPLYKDIPKYSTYYKIIKHNEKVNKRLKKKEPLKFVKINSKMNILFENDVNIVKYKIKNEKSKYIVKIIHKSGDEKIIQKKEFKKSNNKYKIKYDMKVYLLNYLRSTVDDE